MRQSNDLFTFPQKKALEIVDKLDSERIYQSRQVFNLYCVGALVQQGRSSATAGQASCLLAVETTALRQGG